MSGQSAYRRVTQWMVFSRQWYLYDAKWQDVFDSAELIGRHLHGRHKPIYDPEQDCGDHVVVINARHVAMPADEWRYRHYYHHTHYAGGRHWATAHELHLKDPTLVLYKAIYKAVGNVKLKRQELIARLHLYADDKVPQHIMRNVSDQIRQLRTVDKPIQQYTKQQIKDFPKIFDYPEDYAIK
ncbi:39S ribosomal protein L13, mitochondrial-like [Oppia nitens]|uniref:39S ribosomal protein L13, mitochondrial-like n=1 Tax=Oppia nitens TaxID=1686743 RepID=UPI0023DCAF71|nr:39S ribosomal protein L13, mitochondrial-like [Oppia nitens]